MAINVISGGTGDSTYSAAVTKAAYDQLFELALRHRPHHRQLVDKRPADVTNPGQTVTLFIHNDLSPATTPLTDGVDVTPAARPAPDTVDVTVNAYGNAIVFTRLVKEFALNDVDQDKAEQMAWNMADTIDTLVRTELLSGSQVAYGGSATSTATVAGGDTITTLDITGTVARLRDSAVVPRRGDLYAAYLHPFVAHDLRQTVGSGGWLAPHEYSAPDGIWNGETGSYGGAFIVETGRAFHDGDGDTGTEVYRSIVCGRQAIMEAVAIEPQVVYDGKVGADHLSRLETLGWHGVLGWSIYRDEALWRLEHASTLS